MKNRLLGLAAFGFLLSAVIFVTAMPALADNVDQKISALESELARLKGEQMELKKEAVAAAAALPAFSYRPGGGLTITAADQSWAIRFLYEFNMDMTWLEGQDASRNGDFELFGRRNRPYIFYYWDRGLYEFQFGLDMDAGDCSEEGGDSTCNQRARFYVHYNKINPWLPSAQIGMDVGAAINSFDQGSSSTAATIEYPLVRRDNGFNTGAHTGIGFRWDNLPMGFTPGTWNYHYYWVIQGMGRRDGLSDQSSNMDHVIWFRTDPFSKSKNKWINGFAYNIGVWFGNPDERNTTNSNRRARLRTQLGPNRVTLFDSGNDADRGLHTFISTGIQYKVGPYKLLVSGEFDRWNTKKRSDEDKAGRGGEVGRVEGTGFKFINELFVWSPKGLFTGSTSTPRSLLMGWSFERSNADCGRPNCDESGGAQYSRNRVLVRELDFRYFFRPSLSLLLAWRWYDASNVSTTREQVDLGCSKNNNTEAGKGCDWHDVALRLAWEF